MQDNPFNIGDVVRLNSGSCKMVVVYVSQLEVTCAWHTTEWGPQEARYPYRAIRITDPNEPDTFD